MLPQKILNFWPSEVVSGAFWVENCFLRLFSIELRERTGARAAALERMRFAILYAYIRARTHARARVIALGHDVTSTYT